MLSSLTVAATSAALVVVPLAGSAVAGGCAATAVPPHYVYGEGTIRGVGAFGATPRRPG